MASGQSRIECNEYNDGPDENVAVDLVDQGQGNDRLWADVFYDEDDKKNGRYGDDN